MSTYEDRLTYALQAKGPDEFPEGYYRSVARDVIAQGPRCHTTDPVTLVACLLPLAHSGDCEWEEG